MSLVTQIEYKGGDFINVAFYPNIEAERVKNALTKEDLANQLGVERKTYYNWQTNGKIPVTILIKLSDIFNCSVDYLLGRTEMRNDL